MSHHWVRHDAKACGAHSRLNPPGWNPVEPPGPSSPRRGWRLSRSLTPLDVARSAVFYAAAAGIVGHWAAARRRTWGWRALSAGLTA